MRGPNYDITIIDKIRKFFKKPRIVKAGDVGIFHEIILIKTYTDISHDMTYDVYAKVKAIEVYENLVEVQPIDIKVADSVSQDVVNIVNNNFPKYINPSQVNWVIKQDK